MTDLDDVLIGGREKRPIVIADYDPAWPERYAAERARIAGALGERALRIEHIGSTSVPGLPAKPIVDVLVVVDDPDDEPAFVPALEAAGYVLRVREPGHRMLRTPEHDVHVHVWADDEEVTRYLLLRDHLRASAHDRAAYAALKCELATREWDDINDYAAAKGPLIEQILRRATKLAVLDRDMTLEFGFEDLMRYHGPHSPGGVAHAFKVMERAFPELGEPVHRREVRVRTAFGGPGARDAFEIVLRAVSGERYIVDLTLGRPSLGPERERFVFELAHRGARVVVAVRDGFVTPEFVDLARRPGRSDEEDARLDVLKREMADRVMAAAAGEVYDLVAS